MAPPSSSSSTVSIQSCKLDSSLRCPVCLMWMENAVVVRECMHRFCGSCIEKCLRVGKKECPSCRLHIPSRRSLRRDTNVNELLGKILGDVGRYREMENVAVEVSNRKLNINNSVTRCIEEGKIRQSGGTKRKSSSISAIAAASSSSSSYPNASSRIAGSASMSGVAGVGSRKVSSSSSSSSSAGGAVCGIMLRRHPKETRVQRLDREYIRTSPKITVHHLQVFLSRKLGWGNSEEFEILYLTGDEKVVKLDGSVSVEDVKNYMGGRGDVLFHFRIG